VPEPPSQRQWRFDLDHMRRFAEPVIEDTDGFE